MAWWETDMLNARASFADKSDQTVTSHIQNTFAADSCQNVVAQIVPMLSKRETGYFSRLTWCKAVLTIKPFYFYAYLFIFFLKFTVAEKLLSRGYETLRSEGAGSSEEYPKSKL